MQECFSSQHGYFGVCLKVFEFDQTSSAGALLRLGQAMTASGDFEELYGDAKRYLKSGARQMCAPSS